jgi:hypothetical protein
LKEKGRLSGRVTALSRQGQSLFPYAQNVSVIIQMSNDEQVIVKKVGVLTVALNERI